MCDECDFSDDEITGDAWHGPLSERALGSEVAPPDVRPAWRRRLRAPRIDRVFWIGCGVVLAEIARVLL